MGTEVKRGSIYDFDRLKVGDTARHPIKHRQKISNALCMYHKWNAGKRIITRRDGNEVIVSRIK